MPIVWKNKKLWMYKQRANIKNTSKDKYNAWLFKE